MVNKANKEQPCLADYSTVIASSPSSLVQDRDYSAAAQLAFELKQPGRLLAVVQKAYEAGPAQAHLILAALVKQLDQEQLRLSLEYIRDWNTNSRHCSAAQAMLQAILVQHPPEVCLPYVLISSSIRLHVEDCGLGHLALLKSAWPFR